MTKKSTMSNTGTTRIFFVGLGMMNTSLSLAVRSLENSKHMYTCTGWDICPQAAEKALACDAIEGIAPNLAKGLAQADWIIIGVPIFAYTDIFCAITDYAPEQTIVTDIGSVKQQVVALAKKHLAKHFRQFVPAHPIAGREGSGAESAIADLFYGQRLILTPNPKTKRAAILAVEKLWQALGAQTSQMSAKMHDEICAAISHLPHLLSMAMVGGVMQLGEAEHLRGSCAADDAFNYASGGFRDFSRIAGSQPTMWHDIFLANAPAILRQLKYFEKSLKQFRHCLVQADASVANSDLHDYIAKISARQRAWKREKYG